MAKLKVKNKAGEEREVDESKVSLAEADGFLPVVTNGSEERRVSLSNMYLAEKDGFLPKKAISRIESGLRGAAQGASMGFADEITGGLEASKDFLTGDAELADLASQYEKRRDESRQNYKMSEQANPGTYMAGNVAGSLATIPLMPASAATAGGRILQAATTGAVTGYGANENRDKILQDMALGGAVGGVAGGAAEGISKAIRASADPMRELAKRAQVQATGATRVQAEAFRPEAGAFMLDEGLSGFGQSQAGLAEKLKQASKAELDNMLSSAKQASEAGDTVDVNAIVANLENKISELKSQHGNSKLVKELQRYVDDMYETGQGIITPEAAEAAKRLFREGVDYKDKIADKAQKIVSKEFQTATEKSITDKETLRKFLEAKNRYGIIAAPQKAAQKRALQLQQAPVGGLLDTATAAAASPAGIPAQLGAMAGRRIISPRVPATIAYTLDKTSKLIKSPPKMLGKYAPIIKNAAVRGPGAVSVTDFLLEQTDAEYRKMKQEMDNERD